MITEGELVEGVLRPMCERTSQKDVAEQLGFSRAFISDVLSGTRGISSALAEALGYQRQLMFKKIRQ